MTANGKARDSSLISIVIFTKNEEQDLPGCLQSVSWSDDIHVFDSFSTDQTVSIANRSGAKVQQRRFDNFASQKNAALRAHRTQYTGLRKLFSDDTTTALEAFRVAWGPRPRSVPAADLFAE